jgi:LmbE family N-acetylglucosaminyl deacetylase
MRTHKPLLAAVALATLIPCSARAQAQTRPPILAVFAHPDDETIVGPLLARYARQPGTRVHLVSVTSGDQGVTPFAKIPAGAALAAARSKELACACEALGVEPPVLLGMPDGGLGSVRTLAEATAKLEKALADIRPDAIVTWGPDGGYGHADHRLVSAVVTQIVQAGNTTRRLYYAGLPASRMNSEDVRSLRFPAPFAPVADELLNVRVPYSAEDAASAAKSLRCHASQFTPETMALIGTLTEKVHGGRMHLREWAGGPARSELFER